MSTLHLSIAAKNALLQAVADKIDAGSGPGLLKIYTGTMPANVETAVSSQVLLGTLTLSDPCATVADGALTFGAITQDSAADDTGTATWFRIVDSTGTGVLDGDVSDNAGTGVLKLNTTSIVTGGPIQVSSGTLTV